MRFNFSKYFTEDSDPISTISTGLSTAVKSITSIGKPDTKWSKFFHAVNAVSVTVGLGKVIYDYVDEFRTDSMYTVRVTDEEFLIPIVYDWVRELGLSRIDYRSFKSKVAFNSRTRSRDYASVPDDELNFVAEFEGHKIRFSTQDRNSVDYPTNNEPLDRPSKKVQLIPEILISSKTEEGIHAVEEELSRRLIVATSEVKTVKLYTQASYVGFVGKPLPARSPESVILRNGQFEAISEHIKTFRDHEDLYNAKGFPYHTGILLAGPPGTGKTSMGTVLANMFGNDVYQITLSALENDVELAELFSEVSSNSIILLEDIDVATDASGDREGSSGDYDGITLSGLLNCLDGNQTPYGTCIIMTTNDPETLDPALVRPGRADLIEILGYLDQEQLERLCRYYLGDIPVDLPIISVEDEITSGEVVSIVRKHINNMELASRKVVEMLSKKVAHA